MEILPEQELVVKKQGWELMVLRRGINGSSMFPFGDLSGNGDNMLVKVCLFMVVKSI